MTEKPAKGVKGFLLKNLSTDEYFFRVKNNNPFPLNDYEVRAEDISVIIDDDFISLYEGEKRGLDYSSTALGRMPDYTSKPDSGLKKYFHKKERLEEMGVGFYVNDKRYAGWSYSGFNTFRKMLAYEIGLNLLKMEGFTELEYKFGMTLAEHDEYKKRKSEEQAAQIKWNTVDDALVPLLFHSDCDGELSPQECATVGPRLKEVLEQYKEKIKDIPQILDYDVENGMGLVAAMEEAVKTNKPLEFC